MAYLDNGIVFCILLLKKGLSTDSCYNMDEPQKHYAR
jgi:hypothetical protein